MDNNCNGILDENAPDGLIWYLDADVDGFGDANVSVTACTQPLGYASNADDCDDARFESSPVALEFCNGVDDDCDGVVDDEDIVDFQVLFLDTDGDGYGDPSSPIQACAQDPTMVSNNQDCDDGNADVYPYAPEACNGLDDNCNTVVDEGAADLVVYYVDEDQDGYGSGLSELSCSGGPP